MLTLTRMLKKVTRDAQSSLSINNFCHFLKKMTVKVTMDQSG